MNQNYKTVLACFCTTVLLSAVFSAVSESDQGVKEHTGTVVDLGNDLWNDTDSSYWEFSGDDKSSRSKPISIEQDNHNKYNKQHQSTALGYIASNKELRCLAANIFFEARGENAEAQQAVAQVTINRVNSKHYPNDICAVVFQSKQFSWTFQQSSENIQKLLEADLSGYNSLDTLGYQKAYKIASRAVLKPFRGIPSDALWYHADYVSPKWAKVKQAVGYYGTHIFYTKQPLQ